MEAVGRGTIGTLGKQGDGRTRTALASSWRNASRRTLGSCVGGVKVQSIPAHDPRPAYGVSR
jgi:hypothetical protein